MKKHTLPHTNLATNWELCAQFHGLSMNTHPALIISLFSGQPIDALLN